jgi:uncharacterized protein YprB with RNaseH-like and TPR domain
MLERTFCHIQGISPASEKLLWENGIDSWERFIEKGASLSCLPKTKLERIKSELPLSRQALENKELAYFKAMLPPKEHWRLSPLGKIAFVDIETTGLSRWTEEITILGIYDGTTPHLYINGKNLPLAKEKLAEFDIIVTFNGKQFDLPFIEHHFSCNFDFVHLDLRYMLKELGLQGGLKNIERELGIARHSDVQGIDGFEAVHLWRRYKRGDQEALQKLLKYNEEDIVNLKTLLAYYIAQKQELLFG